MFGVCDGAIVLTEAEIGVLKEHAEEHGVEFDVASCQEVEI